MITRHAGEHVMLVVELEPAVEPVHPSRTPVVAVNLDVALRKVHVLSVFDRDKRFSVVIAEKLERQHSLHHIGNKVCFEGAI